jgi:hypothetical protein
MSNCQQLAVSTTMTLEFTYRMGYLLTFLINQVFSESISYNRWMFFGLNLIQLILSFCIYKLS